MGPLDGRRALVCGSTQGIGRACALEFARLGAVVTLAARNETALRQVRDEVATEGSRAGHEQAAARHGWLKIDFSDPQALRHAVARHIETVGPCHILLNNTGGPAPGAIAAAEPFAFLEAFQAHVIGNQILTQAVVPGMKAAGYGRIINIVSTSVRQPIRGLGVSNTIRAAVAGWAKTLAGELASFGVTVNNVLPGSTDTLRLRSLIASRAKAAGVTEADIERQMIGEIPMGRFGRPEEVAAAAGFLASPAASYITGVSLPVDGGRIASI